jgi:acyl carrier protein
VAATVSREVIEKTVTDAVIEFGAEPEDIAPDATLETLDIDSLDLVELGQILEEEYGIEIRPEDAEGIANFGQVIDMIYAKAEAAQVA